MPEDQKEVKPEQKPEAKQKAEKPAAAEKPPVAEKPEKARKPLHEVLSAVIEDHYGYKVSRSVTPVSGAVTFRAEKAGSSPAVITSSNDNDGVIKLLINIVNLNK